MQTTDMILESATLADIEQLVALEQNLFMTDHRSRKNFRYLLQSTTVIVARAEETTNLAGYAIPLTRKNSYKMRIYALGVTASARNTGIGTRLVGALEEIAGNANRRMLTLEVSDRNRAAIALYSKCGFRQFGFRFAYYKDGGHALLMRKDL